MTLAVAAGLGAALERTGYRELTRPFTNPAEPEARMIRFPHEHQWSMYWFLYLRPNGESFIVRSAHGFERPLTGAVTRNDQGGPFDAMYWRAPRPAWMASSATAIRSGFAAR